VRKAPLALALLFLLPHLLWLPTTFDDIDALNFGLGVRDYDVAAHQPHPPGYPVFIAAASAATAVVRAAGVDFAEVRGLALTSVLAATLAIPAIFVLFSGLVQDDRVAGWATLLTISNPVYWFTALRPLSDLPGLALAVGAQAALAVLVLRRGEPSSASRLLLVAATLSGLAIGLRSQTFTLTLPLLALAVLLPNPALGVRARAGSVLVFGVTCLAWAIPMVALNGGVDAYLAALGNQAGEDFVGSAMLWTNRTPRAAAAALQYSLVWPWGGLILGGVVLAAAAVGAVRLLRRQRPSALVLTLAFAPYAAFHLLFQETVMTRYALPLVPPVALLAAYGLAGAGSRALRTGSVGLAAIMLVIAMPASRSFASEPSPGAAAVTDAAAASDAAAIAMHAVMRRHEQWYHDNASGRVLRARHGTEVLGLVDFWKQGPHGTVQFIADPRRSDLALLDPRSRELMRRYEWAFPEMPLMGGARPNRLERFTMRPPGWMLDQGWAVTAEVAGQSARAGARPDLRPSIAWIRSRDTAATLILGGRNLGSAGSPSIRVDARLEGWQRAWDIPPGFFVHTVELPPGALSSSEAYVPLAVTSTAHGDARLSLEQFDLQSSSMPMAAFGEGWQEPEYNPQTGLAWRWMAPRSALWVRPIGRDVVLTLRAESPLVYFDRPPHMRISIGGEQIAQLTPDRDFTWEVTLPASRLSAAAGLVLIESSESFVPGGSAGDQRQLAIRVYAVRVD
jgi:hypothetical protein